MCIDDTLKIKIPDELFYTRLMKQNAIQVLKNVFNEELGLDIEIIFEKSVNKRTDVDKLIKKNESMIDEMVRDRMAEAKILAEEENEVVGNDDIEITEFGENSLIVELTPEQTDLFNEFPNGQNSAKYIWGLDMIDSDNNLRINVFPQTGNAAPLCIVYKHV